MKISDLIKKALKHDEDVERIDEQLETIAINVDNYSNLAINNIWTKAIRKAIEDAKEYGTIIFGKGKEYVIDGQLNLLLKQNVDGNGATLKRANESKTTLSSSALSTSNSIQVSSLPIDWEIGDYIHIYTGSNSIESSYSRKIINISGNTITLNTSIGNLINSSSATTYNVGSSVRKVYSMIEGQQYPIPFNNKIYNLTFDGNKDNNSANYFWNFNNTLHIYGRESSAIGCKFINIPNENIVTHGSLIEDNYAEELNGSFVHLSSPSIAIGEEIMGCNICNNYAKHTNIIPNSITLHSNSVIEQSWNAGKVIVEGNYFEGVGNDYCLDIIEPTDESNGTKYYNDIKYIGNTFRNYKGISRAVNEFITWELNEKIISENIFNQCGYNNFSNLPSKNILFVNNILSNGTVISGAKNIIKGDLQIDNGINIRNSKGKTFGLYNTDNDWVTLQRGSVQYLSISDTDNIQLNSETKILNSYDGEVKINSFQRFIVNTSNTTSPGTSGLNTLYPYPGFAIGSEVYFANFATPAIAKRVSTNAWKFITVSN